MASLPSSSSCTRKLQLSGRSEATTQRLNLPRNFSYHSLSTPKRKSHRSKLSRAFAWCFGTGTLTSSRYWPNRSSFKSRKHSHLPKSTQLFHNPLRRPASSPCSISYRRRFKSCQVSFAATQRQLSADWSTPQLTRKSKLRATWLLKFSTLVADSMSLAITLTL